jgi:hypothetical protein
MSEEKFSGVEALLERMKTHPEEFFESGERRGRWAFIYKDYFKDCLSEAEKGRLHDGLRTIRRMEFEATIVKELLKDEMQEPEEEAFGLAPVKAPGAPVTYGAKKILTGKYSPPGNTVTVSSVQDQLQKQVTATKNQLRQGLMQAQSNAALGKKP